MVHFYGCLHYSEHPYASQHRYGTGLIPTRNVHRKTNFLDPQPRSLTSSALFWPPGPPYSSLYNTRARPLEMEACNALTPVHYSWITAGGWMHCRSRDPEPVRANLIVPCGHGTVKAFLRYQEGLVVVFPICGSPRPALDYCRSSF